ncbi:MAG TPA: VIT domain-containing protein [Longimicrobiales bacterium]|nr:VIT domain-containing protein [Longimicrobiales bacterium]
MPARDRYEHRTCHPFMATVTATLLWLLPAAAAPQGWIEPQPGIAPGQWGIEKLRTSVTVRISDRVAEVEVEEWFRNNGGGLGEGDYLYPLPAGAVFSSYSLYQGEQELRGEMMGAAQAREIYEGIVRAKKDPALIELIGKGMLRARVFPIEAGQTRKITMRYTQMLDRAGDALQFRYAAGARHVGSGVVPMPRPWPGMPQDRPSDGGVRAYPEGAPLTFSIVVEDESRFRDAFSPTHAVRVERARGRMTVRPDGELAGDFAVFLPFADRPVGLTVATHRPAGEDGYFMLTLSPADVAQSSVPRDVTVVMDVSGSMSGDKIDQAKRALQQLLGSLGEDDRFRIAAFSSAVRPWQESWSRAARAEIEGARRWVDDLRADGGTNMHDALEFAFSDPSPRDRLPIVIFLTDGLPTNGETKPDRIVAMAESARGRARVFAFGVGFDVNTYLLDRLSEAARGTTQYVSPGEDVEQAVSALAARVRHPVLTDLALETGGIDTDEIYPRSLPDLFAGGELVVFGRYSEAGAADMTVSGRREGRVERYATRVQFRGRSGSDEYIPRLWASRKLGDLDRRIRSAQADGATRDQVQALIDELRETALRYGLLSEYTSYLVQEPGVLAAARPEARSFAPMAAVSGEAAVARAEGARRSREVTNIAQMDAAQALATERLALPPAAMLDVNSKAADGAGRSIAGRQFTLRAGVWEDAGHTAKHRVVEIAAWSDAHFAILRALPEVALVLREVESVLIAGRVVSLRVGEKGVRSLSEAELRRLVADFRAGAAR